MYHSLTNIKVTVQTLGIDDRLTKFIKHSCMWGGEGDVYNKCYYIIYNILVNICNIYDVKDNYQNLQQSLPEKR